MRAIWLGLTLALLPVAAAAQVPGLVNAEMTENSRITDPARAMPATEGDWLAFSLPVLDGIRSPCCWEGRWNGMGEIGCSLQQTHQSYGSRSDSPLTQNVIVYVQTGDDSLRSLRVMGEQCPVDGGGAAVTWIGSVDETAGMDWLEAMARADDGESFGSSALNALAIHQSTDAGLRLYRLAKEPAESLAEEAIFWLGDARGVAGFDLLKTLLAELPAGPARRHINFALAQNDTSGAVELLQDIALADTDPQQRGDALFWLAGEHPEQAQKILLKVISSEQRDEVMEQAVFAITQLPAEISTQMLLYLATDKTYTREVRRQALFWLANSDDDSAVEALTALLTG
jgi:hypothetical protein